MSENENGSQKDQSEESGETTNVDNPLQKELDKLKSDYLYLKADFENYKKRSIKERSDILKYSAEHAFAGILLVLDNFDRALRTANGENSFESFKQGVVLIEKEFRNVLQQYGVTEIQTLNQKFDPSICESIGYVESDIPEGHVAQVLRNPFKLHDKVIRPGQVLVSSGKKSEAPETH